jgi:hypothetical protein
LPGRIEEHAEGIISSGGNTWNMAIWYDGDSGGSLII